VARALGEGWRHERAALSAGREPLDALRSTPRRYPGLRRAARAADVVHAHGDMAAVLGLPLLRARPALVSTHGLHFLRRSAGARRAAFTRALRAASRAAVVVCTSQAEWDELVPIAGADRMTLVLNGVPARPPPPSREAARASLGLARDDVVALFVGQLEERKRPLLAAHAAAAAGVVLLVAGDGPQAGELAALAGGRVRVLGHVADSERLYAAADVYLAPADREGLSYAMLEAMDAGLAIVASDGPGNPEAVGDAGIVAPTGDEAAWTAALAGLARDPAERARLGAAVAARARTTFSHERFAEGIRAAYERALSG
jgi:glycosyltransferase involved in cell wall biosynthesis